MGSELSMRARAEVTKKYATAYAKAPRQVKSQILDDVCSVTDWSRANARRRLTAKAAQPPRKAKTAAPRPRPRKYSYDALKVLQRVWAVSGGQCGKYLAAAMPGLVANMEAHGRLKDGEGRYSPA
ncbi:MAG: integrase, partial [Bifidobacteriaceae bacterium]|nr:integrase [Bifidobacteriaceae bacterium]